MINSNDSAWNPPKELICKLCGARKPIKLQRFAKLSELLDMFKKFESGHICYREVIKGDENGTKQ